MAVTIKDVAKVCNVSYSTVSRVLNGKCVRESAQNDRIIATAKALGYKPNKLAVQLVKQSSNMLGLLIPDIANPHYSEITKSVEDAAQAAGYRVFLCNTDWDVQKEIMYRDSLLEGRVAGLIVMPVCDESHVIFRGLDIPVVLLGSRTREADLNYVVMDNSKAAFRATEYLIQSGHRRLLYIGRKVENYTSLDRKKGFLQAAAHYGIPDTDIHIAKSATFGLKGGCAILEQMLKHNERPDAVLAFNDFIAIGAMQTIEEAGFAVGRDIAVMGFDDILFSALPKIDLTTITPSNRDMGKHALSLLAAQPGQPTPRGRTAILEPYMVLRSTCRAREGSQERD